MYFLCDFFQFGVKNSMYGDKLKWCVIARNSVKVCKMKPCFCQPIQFSLELCWQNVGNF